MMQQLMNYPCSRPNRHAACNGHDDCMFAVARVINRATTADHLRLVLTARMWQMTGFSLDMDPADMLRDLQGSGSAALRAAEHHRAVDPAAPSRPRHRDPQLDAQSRRQRGISILVAALAGEHPDHHSRLIENLRPDNLLSIFAVRRPQLTAEWLAALRRVTRQAAMIAYINIFGSCWSYAGGRSFCCCATHRPFGPRRRSSRRRPPR